MATYWDHLQTAWKLVTGYFVRHGRKIARPTMIRDVTAYLPRNICTVVIKTA